MTTEADRSMRRHGFAGWADAVSPDQIRRARIAIHRDLGVNGLHPDRLPEFDNASYCPALRRDPDILGLFSGRLKAEAERWLGPLQPVDYAQIALRFPQPPGTPARDAHLDGIAAPHNGVDQGTIATFSALAGVYLSDVEPDGGALTVWPGSHLAHAEYFRRHGPEALLDGMPPDPSGGPLPLVGRSGYGFLVHYLVGHAVGPHCGPDIRYAVFFRLKARQHDDIGRRTMVEPWLEWRLRPLEQ